MPPGSPVQLTGGVAGHRNLEIDATVAAAYAAHGPGLERYVRSLVRDQDAVDDICQETFVRFWTVSREGRPPELTGAWMHRVAHNLAVSRGRRQRTAERATGRLANRGTVASVEDTVLRRHDDEQLTAALGRVSRADRDVMLLAAYGYRGNEISARMGRSEAATRTMLSRARSRLRRELDLVDAVAV
jgi:RNA polymerase sigma-70 factor (ECF subfamily)